nr:hypothetical protein [Tanacetum cinerariifolium]
MVATQNINNSTLSQILQSEKLTGSNFMNFHRNIRISLRSENKLIHLEQPLIPLLLPAASQAARDAYDALFDTQNKMACLMLGSMYPDLQRALENYKEYDMIQELKTMFEEQAKHELEEMLARLALHGLRKRRKMKHGALNLYVGNEIRTAVEAIGSFDLVLPNGLVIILDNCHYAPSITRGVVFVSHLVDNVPCDGIYEIDMQNLYPNGYALDSEAHILNMVPTKKVDKTPYEIWIGNAPNQSYLKVKGCEALVKRDTPDKLEPIIVKYLCVGYPKETMGYYLYNPHENNIFVARYAEFFENKLNLQEASGSHGLLEASGSDVVLELIQEDDTQLSNDTSKRHDEVEPNDVEPHSLEIPIRRSERISQAPNRYGFYVDAEEHELGDINEPPNYRYALSDPESDKWLHAMNAEMQSMKDNQV